MVLVDVDKVTITRPERDLLRDVSITIATGDRIGVVGINGTGKSTLLRIMAGTETPEGGTVRWGRETSIAVLDQDPTLAPGRVRDCVGGAWEGESYLDKLGMTPFLDADTQSLSGGEAKRVALAQTLVAGADLLILDEPTNHLDIGAIHWLEEHLAQHRGAMVLVSHDRHLLDRVLTRVLELDRGTGYVHAGGYAGFLEGRSLREELEQKAESARRTLARKELAWLRRGAPARTRKSKAHIERATSVIEDRPKDAARGSDLDFQGRVPRLGDKVIELSDIGHGHDDGFLFRHVDLLLGPGDRIGVVGLNGTGKSTLLGVMAGRIEPKEGRVEIGPTVSMALHDQNGRSLDPDLRVREAITAGKGEPDWRDVRLMESFWFDEDNQWAPIRLLSGGERRRLQLVLTLSEHPNVLMLDEPTNDLDLDTLRALEAFLDEWPGTLIVVSHDRAFLERTVDDVIVLDGAGRAGRFPGGYAAWETDQRVRSKRATATAQSSTARASTAKASTAQASTARASTSPSSTAQASTGPAAASASKARTKPASGRSVSTIRLEIKQVDNRMARLEKQRAALNDSLVSAGADHSELRSLGAQLAETEAAITEAEDTWLALSEELEDR